MTASMRQQVPCTRKKWYPGLMAYCVLWSRSNFSQKNMTS